MISRFLRPLIAVFFAIGVMAPTLAYATPRSHSTGVRSFKSEQGKDKNKKDDKKDDEEKQTKQERQYQSIKRYSEDQYKKDAEFRQDVDEAYRQKQREHSEYAYFINTRDANDVRVMHTGDKLKVQDTLYDNPMVQDYINRLGQSLVPKSSTRLYAFKVLLNPIPEARSLSTGTVYVSTGLISLADNEAQLSYVLSHEIAHIEKSHWFEDVLIAHGLDKKNEGQKQKRELISLAGIVAGPVARAMGVDSFAAFMASNLAQSPTLLKLVVPDAVASWDKAQEDEADHLALKYMLDRHYDVREVPKFYASLDRAIQREHRAGSGFMADATRIAERVRQVDEVFGGLGNMTSSQGLMIGATSFALQDRVNADMAALQQRLNAEVTALQAPTARPAEPGKRLDLSRYNQVRMEKLLADQANAIKTAIDSGELIGTKAEFEVLMTELKRDNGVRAYYYDMFQMARDNLEDSIRIRSDDPGAHFYYGKVLKLIARTPADKSRAMQEFVKAINLDKREVLPEARLQRALTLIDSDAASQREEIISDIRHYVELYQREHGGSLPPNMDILYDYLQGVGETNWAARPMTNVSTVNTSSVSRPAQPPPRTAEEPPPKPTRRKP